MDEHPDTTDLMLPGTYLEKILHPDGSDSEMLELAIFKEHRFSFYFWNRWLQNLNDPGRPPDLVTIDWHRDLAPPSESEKDDLKQLYLTDQKEVAQFVWSGLDAHNDSHLLSAAYLNLIGDIYLLKNYGQNQKSHFSDRFSNHHTIVEYHTYKDFENAVVAGTGESVYLDIDLDFFIKDKVGPHQLEEVKPYSEKEIAAVINNDSPLFRNFHSKLMGISIATEPRYCGGILKSNHLLEVVLSNIFTKELQWKHLDI